MQCAADVPGQRLILVYYRRHGYTSSEVAKRMAEFNQNIWAPWRMEYIRSLEQQQADDGCFLCQYLGAPADDRANHVVLRGEHAMVLLNRFPYINGHLLVATVRHVGAPDALTEPEQQALTAMTFQAVRLLRETIAPHGFNIGMNIGRCAGAGLPDHLHTHIVPRWNGDTNFMSVCSDTKVVSQSLIDLMAEMKAVSAEHGLPKL